MINRAVDERVLIEMRVANDGPSVAGAYLL